MVQVELVLGVEAALPSFIRYRFTKAIDSILPNRERGWIDRLRDVLYDRAFTADTITTALEEEIVSQYK